MSTKPRKHFEALIEKLHHPDIDIATQAAITLGQMGSYRAVPHLMQELAYETRQAAQSEITQFRIEVARALVKVQIEGAIPTLNGLLKDEDQSVRNEAARLLEQFQEDGEPPTGD